MAGEPLLSVRGLSKRYPGAAGWAMRDVSFEVEAGESLALCGLSGAGKSTLARCLAQFEQPDSGEILFQGRSTASLGASERAELRTQIQIVLQQPAASLNPRFTAEEIVSEPLVIQRRGEPAARARRAAELLELAGLPAGSGRKRALEFSGGERQRLAIARALALGPKLLILDESLSGLDLSVKAQILDLLLELKQRLSLAMILVSHDLAPAAQFADRIAVMDGGSIVECAAAGDLFTRPAHPRTRELVAAALALASGAAL